MSKKINLEAERAYKAIRGEKNKFGSYRKTLFHVHTPESHDYRLFKKWNDYVRDVYTRSYRTILKRLEIKKYFQKTFFKQLKGKRFYMKTIL